MDRQMNGQIDEWTDGQMDRMTAIECWENCMGKNLGLFVYSFWRVRIDLLFFYLSLLKMKRRIENEKILD